MSQMYRKGRPTLKITSKTDTNLSSINMNENQKYHVSQSVPSTPIERNINVII